MRKGTRKEKPKCDNCFERFHEYLLNWLSFKEKTGELKGIVVCDLCSMKLRQQLKDEGYEIGAR